MKIGPSAPSRNDRSGVVAQYESLFEQFTGGGTAPVVEATSNFS